MMYPSGPLAIIIPERKIGNNAEPGGEPAIVPIVAAIVNPIADPKSADTNPTRGPRKIETTNIAAGANVIADSGGGSGKAVTVKTVISADITADCAIVVTRLLLDERALPLPWVLKIQPCKKCHTRSGNMLEKSRVADGLPESNCNLIFFPPPVLSGSGSEGRQRISRPLSRVPPAPPVPSLNPDEQPEFRLNSARH